MCNPPKEYDSALNAGRLMPYSGKNERFFKIARKSALCSAQSDYKHGAVLVKGGSVINTSCNKNRRVSFGTRFCTEHEGTATLHAELGAILGLDRSITEGASIYVCRVGKDGELRLSKPCSMCHQAMTFVGIKKVYWSVDTETCAVAKL